MLAEIIYEKKYPHIDLMAELAHAEAKESRETEMHMATFDEMMEKTYANTTYILIPERIESSKKFIQTAIEVSALYKLDIRIERHVDHISVDYSFHCGGGMREINRVFGMADQFSFFKDIFGRDITISMDYFTHAVVRNGRIVAP